jgi:glycosyltransferase involved in cell wall biosynthesis
MKIEKDLNFMPDQSVDTPFFSLIIPTYNRVSIIGKTIDSALNQSFEGFELIIVDDGSTDNTEEFVSSYDDDRIRYFKKTNEERAIARNYGATKAQGEFVYFLDSDDIIYSNHLEEASKYINRENRRLFFQQYEFLYPDNKIKPNYEPRNLIINAELIEKGNFLSCHGVFISRDLFLKNKFDENRTLTGSEDYELWLRLASKYDFYFNSKVTSALVSHEDRSVLNFDHRTLIERKELMLSKVLLSFKNHDDFKTRNSTLKANTYAYLSLHLAMMKKRLLSVEYLFKTVYFNPFFILDIRFFGVLKNLFF